MLFSIGIAVLLYYAVIFAIGVLTNVVAVEGTLICLAVVCFVGGYYARSSVFVYRMCMWVGGIATALVIATWLILPMLQGSGKAWVTIIAVIGGVVAYIVSRPTLIRRWLTRNRQTGLRPAPPFGREWARWVVVIFA